MEHFTFVIDNTTSDYQDVTILANELKSKPIKNTVSNDKLTITPVGCDLSYMKHMWLAGSDLLSFSAQISEWDDKIIKKPSCVATYITRGASGIAVNMCLANIRNYATSNVAAKLQTTGDLCKTDDFSFMIFNISPATKIIVTMGLEQRTSVNQPQPSA